MEQAIRGFLSHLQEVRGRSRNTLLAYRSDLLQFAGYLAEQVGRSAAPGDLSAESLAGYGEWLRQRGYRAATITRKMAALRTFLDHLGQAGGRDLSDLAQGLRPPPAPKTAPRVLTDQELEALLHAPERANTSRALRDAAALALLYATGLRASQMVTLDTTAIDLAQGLVRLPHGSGAARALPLGRSLEPLARYLGAGRPHMSRRAGELALFLNQRGQRLSRQGLWLIIKRWAAACGLEEAVSPHTLRHTLAQRLLDSGRTRRQVQRLLSTPSAAGGQPAPDPEG